MANVLKFWKKTAIQTAAAAVILVVFQSLISTGAFNQYYTRVLITICINIMLALSANLIINISGQLTLGHTAFMAIGAYAAAVMSMHAHLPFFFALLAGGLVAAFFGLLIGLPTLRLKGDYLAITTLGFCQIVVVAFQNINFLGGAQGLTGIPYKTNFMWVYVSMVVMIFLLYNLVHSRHGRAMISVREDEIAAQSMGINTTRYKIMAFTVGAFFAGFAGGLYAHLMMYIEPNSFNFMQSVNVVIFVVLGGAGGIIGCMTSTTLLTLLQEALRPLGGLDMVIYPFLLIVIMLLRVKGSGLSGIFGRFTKLLRKPNAQGGK